MPMPLTDSIDIDKRERPAQVNIYRDATFLSQCCEREARQMAQV